MIEVIFIGLYVIVAIISYMGYCSDKIGHEPTDIIKAAAWPIYAVNDYINKIRDKRSND